MQLEMRLLSRANISAMPKRQRHKPKATFSKELPHHLALRKHFNTPSVSESYVNTCGANIY